MKLPIALAFLLAAPAAWAQDVAFRETRIPVTLQEDPGAGPPRPALTIVQRFGVPDGDLGPVNYEDLFDFGYGFAVEFDYLMPAGLGWRYGPYFNLGTDWFQGQREFVGGTEYDAETAAIFSLIAGIKGAVMIDENFYLELRLGVGLSHFFSTDAEIVGTGTSVELLDASTEIGGEIGLRAGFNLGKLMKLDFGAGARARGSAEEGDVALDPSTMLQYFFDIGVGFRF
jgi:hypothetical protein